ncbi:MAG: hypothetical protein WA771_07960 [Chthoniobacterales bacterium]
MIAIYALGLSALAGRTAHAAPDAISAVEVADTSTRVQVAKVSLSVGTMTARDGNLVGTYSITVPLMESKSETGQIVLPLTKNLASYVQDGGSLTGTGVSAKDSEDGNRKIEARFSPVDPATNQGRINLQIQTSQRTLEFDSTYRIAEPTSAAN